MLLVGVKLLLIREYVEVFGCLKNIVISVFEMFVVDGLIELCCGFGFFVM